LWSQCWSRVVRVVVALTVLDAHDLLEMDEDQVKAVLKGSNPAFSSDSLPVLPGNTKKD